MGLHESIIGLWLATSVKKSKVRSRVDILRFGVWICEYDHTLESPDKRDKLRDNKDTDPDGERRNSKLSYT
jgi:hypothetical protein